MLPRTFQARLTLAFVGVTALTVALISLVVLNRLDDYFQAQERANLPVRALNVRDVVGITVDLYSGPRPPVSADNVVDSNVVATLAQKELLDGVLANQLAQADVTLVLGLAIPDQVGGWQVVPGAGGTFQGHLTAAPQEGQSREGIGYTTTYRLTDQQGYPYALQITLADPYTFRASTIANVAGLLLVIGTIGLALSVVVAAFLALRFAIPLRRLTEGSRRLAEGDMSSRVPTAEASSGSAEIAELTRQFNSMAARLEESVEIIRRDRDRSRDFLADVSHELRTPIAALRTFNELLEDKAGADPATRAEFLEASSQQIGRLDWLSQNLLELSRLDSGLLLLDLRPDDLRACVESAVEQNEPAAQRRGIDLSLELPDDPVRILHDPQRIGQVISNLVGNAIKFTPHGGRVRVSLRGTRDGAAVEVSDTGVGIDASELPHIFERFYRGSRTEARSSGSGLGLAIARSIVDMHRGRITVESRVGGGSRFQVLLPRDQRGEGVRATAREDRGAASKEREATAARTGPAASDRPATLPPDRTP